MKIMPESAWLLNQAFANNEINYNFLNDVYSFVVAQMEGRGRKLKPDKYVFTLQKIVKSYEAQGIITRSQAAGTFNELVSIFRSMNFIPSSDYKYADVDDNPLFSDFITDKLMRIFNDPSEKPYTPSFYLASLMVCLYYHAYLYSSPSYSTPLEEIVEEMSKADFMKLFSELKNPIGLVANNEDYRSEEFTFIANELSLIEPVDTTHYPSYVLENSIDYVFSNGKWYSYHEIKDIISKNNRITFDTLLHSFETDKHIQAEHQKFKGVIKGVKLISTKRDEMTLSIKLLDVPKAMPRPRNKPLPKEASASRLTFAEHLKVERQRQGLTLEDLAEKTGLTSRYISQVERGIRNITIDHLDALARGLGVTLKELL